MKPKDIALGGIYENEDGTEVREVTGIGMDKTGNKLVYYKRHPITFGNRRESVTRKEFAAWAARPVDPTNGRLSMEPHLKMERASMW